MSYGLLTMENASARPIPLLLADVVTSGSGRVEQLFSTLAPSNGGYLDMTASDNLLANSSWLSAGGAAEGGGGLLSPTGSPAGSPGAAARPESVVGLSLLFCAIGLVGIVGNFLVIYVIMSDRKMRSSVTNLFILNLAAADLLIMLFGVPEIAQFMVNRGWLLGAVMCRIERYVLVVSLYVSIMSLVSVCIERYIAIVHAIHAHILCNRRRIVLAISVIWPVALLLGLPIVLLNEVRRPHPNFPAELCMLAFPGNAFGLRMGYKYAEFTLFFLGPVVIQSILYAIICKQLFVGTKELHRRPGADGTRGGKGEKESDTIRARKGVVKMLIASVMVYFFSYAPAQLPLVYNTISATPFNQNWAFLVLVMTLGYVNSAANPILYCIFSQNFRRCFRRALCSCIGRNGKHGKLPRGSAADTSMATRGVVRFSHVTGAGGHTATTALMSEA